MRMMGRRRPFPSIAHHPLPLLPFLLLLFHFPICQSALSNPKWQFDRGLIKSEMDFMRKLFDQLKDEKAGEHTATTTTTTIVVGYAPIVQAKCGGQNGGGVGKDEKFGLEFRLNELKPGERMVRADLHLFFPAAARFPTLPLKHRKIYGRNAKIPPKQMELLIGTNCRAGERVVLERTGDANDGGMPGAGWGVFDAIRLLARGGGGGDNLFVQLYGKNLTLAQMRRMVHLHRPFLVVYTKLSEKVRNDAKRAKREAAANYEEEEGIRGHMEAARKTAEYYAYGMARGNIGDGMPIGREGGGQMEEEGKNWSGKKGPTALLNRRKMNQKKKKKGRKWKNGSIHPRFDPNDPMLGFGTPNSPWDRNGGEHRRLLQSPNFGNSLNDIRALHENKYKMEGRNRGKAKSGKAQKEEEETKVILLGKEEDGKEEEEEEDAGKGKKCAVHNLTVDFRQVGWADRIIAPKRFEAGYCAGPCQYPLDQHQQASNHALLQSLIAHEWANKNIEGGPPPPPVCCTPTKFDSLTLLYFDERDNVVLKNYPRMAVLQCGCI